MQPKERELTGIAQVGMLEHSRFTWWERSIVYSREKLRALAVVYAVRAGLAKTSFYIRPALSQPLKSWKYYAPKFGNGVTGPAAHLLTLIFFKSDLISSRNRENIYFPSNINSKIYTKARQPMALVLGVNIPWGMPQVQKPLKNPHSIYIKRYMACIQYPIQGLDITMISTKSVILTPVFLFSTSIFFHAFLRGKTTRLISAPYFFQLCFRQFWSYFCFVLFLNVP